MSRGTEAHNGMQEDSSFASFHPSFATNKVAYDHNAQMYVQEPELDQQCSYFPGSSPSSGEHHEMELGVPRMSAYEMLGTTPQHHQQQQDNNNNSDSRMSSSSLSYQQQVPSPQQQHSSPPHGVSSSNSGRMSRQHPSMSQQQQQPQQQMHSVQYHPNMRMMGNSGDAGPGIPMGGVDSRHRRDSSPSNMWKATRRPPPVVEQHAMSQYVLSNPYDNSPSPYEEDMLGMQSGVTPDSSGVVSSSSGAMVMTSDDHSSSSGRLCPKSADSGYGSHYGRHTPTTDSGAYDHHGYPSRMCSDDAFHDRGDDLEGSPNPASLLQVGQSNSSAGNDSLVFDDPGSGQRCGARSGSQGSICRGVYFDSHRGLWRANWPEELSYVDAQSTQVLDVRRCTRTKGFSAKKYGFEEAQRLAVKYRQKMVSQGMIRHILYVNAGKNPGRRVKQQDGGRPSKLPSNMGGLHNNAGRMVVKTDKQRSTSSSSVMCLPQGEHLQPPQAAHHRFIDPSILNNFTLSGFDHCNLQPDGGRGGGVVPRSDVLHDTSHVFPGFNHDEVSDWPV